LFQSLFSWTLLQLETWFGAYGASSLHDVSILVFLDSPATQP